MKTIRWGIISTGRIAQSFAVALQAVDDAELIAVASRSHRSAEIFATANNIPNFYDTYEALVNNPDVDVVYIGTPHVFHAENIMMCLNAGKHVLCEKPFAINAKEAQMCVDLAREKGLFLMEAMWTRYLPAIAQVRQWLKDDLLGKVTLVKADFNVHLPFDPNGRIYNPALGGGALLDVGIYPVSFAVLVLGLPKAIYSHALMGQTGVDEQVGMLFKYENGVSAVLSCGVTQELPNDAFIKGERGSIRIHSPFWQPQRVTLARDGEQEETFDIPYSSTGLNYEVAEVHHCLREGLKESAIMPLDETIAIMELLDSMRAEWGLRYPSEI